VAERRVSVEAGVAVIAARRGSGPHGRSDTDRRHTMYRGRTVLLCCPGTCTNRPILAFGRRGSKSTGRGATEWRARIAGALPLPSRQDSEHRLVVRVDFTPQEK